MKRVFFCIFMFLTVILSSEGRISYNLLDVLDEDLRWLIQECADGYGIPTDYLVRQMFLESTFDETAVYEEWDGTVSVGLFQINSSNFEWMSIEFYEWEEIDGAFDPYNMYHNVQVACSFLRYLNDLCDGDWIATFICFNSGRGNYLRNTYPDKSMDYAQFIVTGKDVYGNYDKRIREFHRLVLDN